MCARLGLVSLAYLWQRDQGELVDEMIQCDVNAVVVKVASMGLKPAHLGRSLAQLRGTFAALNEQFGFHEAGEGGEYETLCLDCPLYRKRVVLEPGANAVVMHARPVVNCCAPTARFLDSSRYIFS